MICKYLKSGSIRLSSSRAVLSGSGGRKFLSTMRTSIMLLLLLLLTIVLKGSYIAALSVEAQQFIPIQVVNENVANNEADNESMIQLPDGFQIGYGPLGLTLMWSPPPSSGIVVDVEGSRHEFRLSSNWNKYHVFGYPREINQNQLHMAISKSEKEVLAVDGMKLEVWKSGKRLDRNSDSGSGIANGNVQANQDEGYDSKPPVTPILNVNPAAIGKYTTSRLSYNLRPLNVTSYLVPLEVLAEVTQPRGVPSTTKSPLVLFLHGRHATCFSGNFARLNWPCPEGYLPIQSYKGFRYVADALASQGYLVVSISANSINFQDNDVPDYGANARSRLIHHHLKLWSDWNLNGGDPWGGDFFGRVNMDKIVLVGHSRGGEGVNRAAIDASSSDPYKIVGLVSYVPTAIGQQVTPDVHSVTILSTCDGDVSDLSGQTYIDRSRDIAFSDALRSAVTAYGTNHNYFNTVWTPGLTNAPAKDDWKDPSDPICGVGGSLRRTIQEQQAVGAAYTAALIRLAVNQEISMLPLLDGSFVKPVAIGGSEVSVSAIGGAGNILLYRPGIESISLQNGMSGNLCVGFPSYTIPYYIDKPLCGGEEIAINSPHFYASYGVGPPPLVQELNWSSRKGARVRFGISGRSGANLTRSDWINIRVANDPNKPPAQVDVLIQDNRGRNASIPLNVSTIDGWPGTGTLDRLHARSLRGRLQTTTVRSQVDLSRITSIFLVSRTANGRIWVFDIYASQERIIQPTPLNLPAIFVDSLVFQEGDGDRQATVKVQVYPRARTSGEAWLWRRSTDEIFQVNITAGSRVLFRFPVTWIGNTVYDDPSSFTTKDDFILIATKGVVTSNYIGGHTILEDDPKPILSAVANNVTASEGQLLRWTLNLSNYTNGLFFIFEIEPPTDGTMELYSDDVGQAWLEDRIFNRPYPPLPLSDVGFNFVVFFDYGETSREIVIPIATDRVTESAEVVRLTVQNYKFSTNPLQPNLTLIGTVLAS